jgi:hypothetical protein
VVGLGRLRRAASFIHEEIAGVRFRIQRSFFRRAPTAALVKAVRDELADLVPQGRAVGLYAGVGVRGHGARSLARDRGGRTTPVRWAIAASTCRTPARCADVSNGVPTMRRSSSPTRREARPVAAEQVAASSGAVVLVSCDPAAFGAMRLLRGTVTT